MKLRKYLSMLLGMILLASCSNDGMSDGTPAEDVVSKGAVSFTLSFPGRKLMPSTYAITNGTLPAEVKEKALNGGVNILVFDNIATTGKPGKLVSVERVQFTVEPTPEKLEDGAASDAKGKLFLRKLFGEKAHFVAVANLDFKEADFNAMLNKSFEQVAKTLVRQAPGDDNHFPMVSEPLSVTVPQSGNVAPTQNLMLERLAVRIDIWNETKEFSGTTFEITDVQFPAGDLNQSYLMQVASPLKVGVEGTEYNPFYWMGVASKEKKVEAQIYTYENSASDFVLKISGKLKKTAGLPNEFTYAYFNVPFNRPLVRNTRYIVKLKNANDAAHGIPEFTIDVAKWTDGGVSKMETNDLREKPSVKSIKPANTSGVAASLPVKHTLDNTSLDLFKKITVENDAYDFVMEVESNLAPRVEIKKGPRTPDWVNSWVKITDKTLDANAKRRTYHINIAKNEDVEDPNFRRNAEIVFYTDGNNDNEAKNRVIKIEQKGQLFANIKNPLAQFAKSYLDAPNKLAQEATFEKYNVPEVWGKGYQWGRNVAFEHLGYKKLTDSQVALNDPLVPGDKVIGLPVIKAWVQRNWTTADLTGKSWAETVNAYTGANATAYHYRNGDPAPENFEIPELEEMIAICPPYGVRNYKILGTTKKYTGERNETKAAVSYAIMFKAVPGSSDNTYLTAYRYEWVEGVGYVIRARHLGEAGATKTLEDISKESFWNDNNRSDVYRLYSIVPQENNYYKNMIRLYSATYASIFWFRHTSDYARSWATKINTSTNIWSIIPIRVR